MQGGTAKNEARAGSHCDDAGDGELRVWIGGLRRLRRSNGCSSAESTAGTRAGPAARTCAGPAARTFACAAASTRTDSAAGASATSGARTSASDDILGNGVMGSAATEH